MCDSKKKSCGPSTDIMNKMTPRIAIVLFIFQLTGHVFSVSNETSTVPEGYFFPLKELLHESYDIETKQISNAITDMTTGWNIATLDRKTSSNIITNNSSTQPTITEEHDGLNHQSTTLQVEIIDGSSSPYVVNMSKSDVTTQTTIRMSTPGDIKKQKSDIRDPGNSTIIETLGDIVNFDPEDQLDMLMLLMGNVDLGVLMKGILDDTGDKQPQVPLFLINGLRKLQLSPACYEDKVRVYQDFLDAKAYAIKCEYLVITL